ncbi:MAG TPA: hypothetical protein VGP82_18595 [Ktedonobacterales bacterium]|jgi:hypothetical protein|nr:hypothetical protein [Ktedonobacterales bacterium]
MIDASNLVPEAQPIAQAAAEALIRHTEPWLVGVMAHGSAYKGGFIPACSDVDMQLYLEPAAFAADSQLPLDLCIAIHRELARIDPAPFGYIQIRALASVPAPTYIGPIPGAYTMIAGTMPLPEATEQQLRDSSRAALDQLKPIPDYLPAGLLDHGAARLARQTRWLCTDVWPTLYRVLALRTDEALGVWRLPKEQAIALLPEDDPLGASIRTFHTAVCAHYPAEATVDGALAVIETGVALLRAAKTWWERQR